MFKWLIRFLVLTSAFWMLIVSLAVLFLLVVDLERMFLGG